MPGHLKQELPAGPVVLGVLLVGLVVVAPQEVLLGIVVGKVEVERELEEEVEGHLALGRGQ